MAHPSARAGRSITHDATHDAHTARLSHTRDVALYRLGALGLTSDQACYPVTTWPLPSAALCGARGV